MRPAAGAECARREAWPNLVGPTAKALSCAARAHVATATRRAACPHLKCAMLAACRRSGTAERGGSAAGPEPGRVGFCVELGRGNTLCFMKVFLAWHEYDNQGRDEAKLLGVFSTHEHAEAAIEARRDKPGFIDHPEGFEIAEVTVDYDQEWMEGFLKWRDL